MLTYTDIKNQFYRNINLVGSNDANILADFQSNLGSRYQLIFAKLQNYKTQQQFTATTIANQQFYSLPPQTVNIDSVIITVGAVNYPLQIINSQKNWDQLNAILIQASALPQFIFPRKDDFGVWPIPQDAYVLTFNQWSKDRNMLVEDYDIGTVQVTQNSITLLGTNTVWTAGMVGRWVTITDTSVNGEGYWYRITAVSDVDSLSMNAPWFGDNNSALTYRIGEVPEIPEEGHTILCDGVTSDYYSGMRKDLAAATWFNNKFYTGDGNNNSRNPMDNTINGGLIGMAKTWQNRSRKTVINRRPKLNPLQYKVWATSLS